MTSNSRKELSHTSWLSGEPSNHLIGGLLVKDDGVVYQLSATHFFLAEAKKLGAKIVEFAGFEMPIQYSSIRDEHRRVRETVGVFDVSHMGEIEIWGDKALELVQKITINDASVLEISQVQYSAMCYEDGGIVDDLLVYRFADHYLLVVNASNKDKDLEWIMKNKIDGCEVKDTSDEVTQIAVQGKKAEKTLQKLTAVKFYFI